MALVFFLWKLVSRGLFSWCGLLKSPAFLATSVLTLAVGLALLTVVFAVFNAQVLRPLAVRSMEKNVQTAKAELEAARPRVVTAA